MKKTPAKTPDQIAAQMVTDHVIHVHDIVEAHPAEFDALLMSLGFHTLAQSVALEDKLTAALPKALRVHFVRYSDMHGENAMHQLEAGYLLGVAVALRLVGGAR